MMSPGVPTGNVRTESYTHSREVIHRLGWSRDRRQFGVLCARQGGDRAEAVMQDLWRSRGLRLPGSSRRTTL